MEKCSGKAVEEERMVESVRPTKALSPESKMLSMGIAVLAVPSHTELL